MDSEKYQESLDWLFSRLPMFSRIGAPAYKPGLETTERLDEAYGHPHRKFKSIHIGGTNGKGSTSHMIASVLQAQGYKTGLYTSPHLTDFRERIRINGEMIPKREVTAFVEEWKASDSDTRPSFFELTMMMAFDWFAREKVDYAVIEVGMGGRLDSTNVIMPITSVITNISFDHTMFLGDTLEKIAYEKAGIIKPGVPVVVGEAEGEVKGVFERKASLEGSEIRFADENAATEEKISRSSEGWKVELSESREAVVPLKGAYQKKNLLTVLQALEVLREAGVVISEESIREGLEKVTVNTGLRGRWQVVNEKPLTVCDTGHNMAGLTENMETLRSLYAGRKLRFVIGFVNDKDVSHIVDIFPKDAEYYITRASIPRAMGAEEVAKHLAEAGISGKIFPDVESAYAAALRDSGHEDVIYVGGSTFIVADFLASREK